MARVVAFVPDLLFGSKVAEMLGGAGHDVVFAGEPGGVGEHLAGADALVVDLTDRAAERIDAVAAAGAIGATPILGFYAHVEADVRASAEAAGFDLVIPRSRMAREGADVLARLLAG